jgi:hypothetical protein
VTVDIAFLFDDPERAQRAVQEQDPFGRDPVPVTLGTESRHGLRWDDTNTGVDLVPRIRISMAVGRCVANVETLGDSKPLLRLATTVAEALSDPSRSPGCTSNEQTRTPR